jgi:hypothetical protein
VFIRGKFNFRFLLSTLDRLPVKKRSSFGKLFGLDVRAWQLEALKCEAKIMNNQATKEQSFRWQMPRTASGPEKPGLVTLFLCCSILSLSIREILEIRG